MRSERDIGRECTGQMLTVKQMMEKFCEKNKCVYVAFMQLEKAYVRMFGNAMW